MSADALIQLPTNLTVTKRVTCNGLAQEHMCCPAVAAARCCSFFTQLAGVTVGGGVKIVKPPLLSQKQQQSSSRLQSQTREGKEVVEGRGGAWPHA